MKLCLISRDRELYQLCAGLLETMSGGDDKWEIIVQESFKTPGDLVIWDYHQDLDICQERILNDEQNHVFLVHRRDAADLTRRLPLAAVQLLLKPVNRAGLEAVFERLTRRTASGALNSWRAQRDDLLQCLLETNVRLQEYDQDRTNFLARAVHDFRAPLTALDGYCGLLLGGFVGSLSPEQKDVLARMQHSIKRLSRNASAMFELSVRGQVDRRLDVQPADLEECIEQALHEIGPLLEEKQITVTVDAAACPETLRFDRARLEQVLINLLDNACKFTPKGGWIEVSGGPYVWERRLRRVSHAAVVERRVRQVSAPNSYRVQIRDSGSGIPTEHLAKIFEEYTSYAGSRDRSGGGLGLAICKAIMQAHEGRIWAEPSPEGAVFSFVLPFVWHEGRLVVERTHRAPHQFTQAASY